MNNDTRNRSEEEIRMIEFGKQLFLRKLRGEITSEEFNKETAYWILVETFPQIKYIPMPTPTGDILEYYKLPSYKRKKVSEEFYEQIEVIQFLKVKKESEDKNVQSLNVLDNLLKLLPEDDKANYLKVEEKYKNIKSLFEQDMKMYEPEINDYSSKPDTYDKEVNPHWSDK